MTFGAAASARMSCLTGGRAGNLSQASENFRPRRGLWCPRLPGRRSSGAGQGHFEFALVYASIRPSAGLRRSVMKQFRLFGLAFAAALCAGQVQAEDLTGTLKNIKETGAITLGVRDSSIPFSYLDDNQKPVGFAIDICMGIVDAVKKELKLDKLEVKLNPVTSST